MDFTPTPEQEMIRKQVREFAEREIKPVAPKFDAAGEFPKETVSMMAGLGLLGMLVPQELEGGGLDTVSYAIGIEEVARVDGSHGLIMAAHNSLGTGSILIGARRPSSQSMSRTSRRGGSSAHGDSRSPRAGPTRPR